MVGGLLGRGAAAALVGALLVGTAAGAATLGGELAVSSPAYGNRATADSDPVIACAPAACLAAWWGGWGDTGVRGARLSADGKVDGAGFNLGAGRDARFPSVAVVGSTFLVVWLESDLRVVGRRVAGDGTMLGPPFPIAGAPQSYWRPRVGADSAGFFVGWRQGNDIGGVRVGVDGSIGTPQTLSTAAGTQDAVTVAGATSGFLVAWEDQGASSSPDVGARRVSSSGVPVGDPFGVATATYAETAPAIASDGSNWLVLWQDDDPTRSTRSDIWGSLVSAGGAVGTPHAVAAAVGEQGSPSAAWDGYGYLAAWGDSRDFSTTWFDVYGVQVDGAGNPDADHIPLSTAALDQHRPSVASTAAGFAVAWEDRRFYDSPSPDVYVLRVGSDGSKLDPPETLVSRQAHGQYDAAAVWNGAGYFAAWTEWSLDFRSARILGGRLSPTGERLDASGIPISGAEANPGNPKLAWSGSEYLVVWRDARNYAASDFDVFGAILGPDGVPRREFAISSAPEDQSDPVVTWSGTNFLVVWRDTRHGPIGDGDIRRSGSDLYGARVTAAGDVLDPDGQALVVGPHRDLAPQLAWSGTTHLLVWSRYDGPPPTDVPRQVVGRRLGANAELFGGEIPIASTSVGHSWPQVASDGTGFLVAWMDGEGGGPVRAARVDADGALLDPGGIGLGVNGWYPSVAWSGADYVVSRLAGSQPYTLRGRRVSPRGGPVSGDFELVGSTVPSFHHLGPGPGNSVVAAYTRRDDSVEAGGADRAFLRLIGPDTAVQPPAAPPPPPPPPPATPPPARPPAQVRCVVPRLRGLTTLRARRLLTARRCRLGRVRKAYARKVKKGRIISQSRRPGLRLARGTRVNIVVSRGARRRR